MSDGNLATVLYPDDAPNDPPSADQVRSGEAAPVDQPTVGKPNDRAATMYGEDATAFDPQNLQSMMMSRMLTANQQGDEEWMQSISAAQDGLAADMEAAGTSTADFDEAFHIVNQYTGDDLPDEKREAMRETTVTELSAEWGDEAEANLNIARSFIRDLEKVAPGTIDTLERSGAGNDPKLIRKVVAEAKRRGYKG
jgi:hypothetical protein